MPEQKSALAGRRKGERNCPRCGATFTCGMEAGQEKCWCADLPPLPIDPVVPGCFCPDCLKLLSAAQPGQASK
ncbi:MAG: cysteine-rich CWC family protein [Rhodocyclaceae bacterium]|nr:cysteine-rich CWC family protein [Rhodocyclaceae bacterium]